MTALRVAIDARFRPGTSGGVETVVMGLAQGFAGMSPSDVRLTFVTYRGCNDWIRPYLGTHLNMVSVLPPTRLQQRLRRARVWSIRPHGRSFGALPRRDSILSSLDVELVHFPSQVAYRVRQPFIYHPHDLQHRHLPEFFSSRQIAAKEITYRHMCRKAAAVSVGTSWVKCDLVEKMHLDPARVWVVPLAPFSTFNSSGGSRDIGHLALPPRYIVYPAVPWPHKNHARLFDAIALLRRRGVDVHVVLTGSRRNGLNLAELARASAVSDLVRDVGYLSQAEVEGVIEHADAVIVPTLFEAASFPVWEAFRLGTAVACSNVTSLPRQVGNAGIVFDPLRSTSIAAAIESLWLDAGLRARLARLGRTRASEFSWEETARRFLALYRKVAGRQLSGADGALLLAEPSL